MFLTLWSPMSKKPIGNFSPTCSRTEALTQISPGSASVSRRAATLTPSPKMSPSSTITSPRLMPIRRRMRRGSGTCALRSSRPCCTTDSATHRIDDRSKLYQDTIASRFDDAALVLSNQGIDKLAPVRLQCRERALLVGSHKSRVASDITAQDSSETPIDSLLFRHDGLPCGVL